MKRNQKVSLQISTEYEDCEGETGTKKSKNTYKHDENGKNMSFL